MKVVLFLYSICNCVSNTARKRWKDLETDIMRGIKTAKGDKCAKNATDTMVTISMTVPFSGRSRRIAAPARTS